MNTRGIINELLDLAYWNIQLIIFYVCERSLHAVLSDCYQRFQLAQLVRAYYFIPQTVVVICNNIHVIAVLTTKLE